MQQLVENLPTSNLEVFKDQLNNPNKEYKNVIQKNTAVKGVRKNIVLSLNSDRSGCGHIRNIFPLNYMNSVFGKTGKFDAIITPIMIFQEEVLKRTRSIFFQRTMSPAQYPAVLRYKELQKKHKFKTTFDLDDFIWDGDDVGEEIPPYNFGKKTIGPDVQKTCIDIMKLMDTVCLSTQFLADYVVTKGVDKNRVKVVHNSVSQFFWGTDKKPHITKRLDKPRVIWSASPTHWSNELKLAGDMDNAWQEWVKKSVMEDKIHFIQMGGLPWFFESIKDKITIVPWVNSYQYHLAVKNTKPDFGISPLVPNYFNYSKSYIKYQEYCAIGALGIGSVFTNGKPSPYEVCNVKAPDSITVEGIDDIFKEYCEPDRYNEIIDKQYQQLIDNSWYTESAGYVNMLLSIF